MLTKTTSDIASIESLELNDKDINNYVNWPHWVFGIDKNNQLEVSKPLCNSCIISVSDKGEFRLDNNTDIVNYKNTQEFKITLSVFLRRKQLFSEAEIDPQIFETLGFYSLMLKKNDKETPLVSYITGKRKLLIDTNLIYHR